MSSHREAPEISKDPVADSTDLYAFVSPDNPDTVTLIANYVPLQGPAGGPNFYEFGNDVLYTINIDNDGDGDDDIVFELRFETDLAVGKTFLYNVGPILSLTDAHWNRRQTYNLDRVDYSHDGSRRSARRTRLATNVPCPPCNIGPLSTPNYPSLAAAAIHPLPGGGNVFAGQRAEGFYVDLGSIFDLADLRPIEQLHTQFGLAIPELTKSAKGVNATKQVNVHSIALQLPKTQLTHRGINPSDPTSSSSVIGVYTTASRQKVRLHEEDGPIESGPWTQVSRLGNPLFNEVLVPMERKDRWNRVDPNKDSQFADGVAHPELSVLLPILYPGAFPNLDALNKSGAPRADLTAVFLTGIRSGIVPGFQNFTGPVLADRLRLNMAIGPTKSPNNLGLVAGDAAGWPNGRRVFDDVVTIELRALAGLTYPLVAPTYVPDGAVAAVTDGLTSSPTDLTAMGTENYLSSFPYLGLPHSGFSVPAA